VEVMNDNEQIEHRSMAYPEYFARGTEPTTYCDLHPTRRIFDRVASIFGGEEKPVPPKVEDTGLPAVAAATVPTTGVVEIEPQPQPEPKKKRGFWSKLFGIGKDRDQSDNANEDKPTKK